MSRKRLLDEMEEFIREKIVKERWTHKRLSVYLQQRFPKSLLWAGLNHIDVQFIALVSIYSEEQKK